MVLSWFLPQLQLEFLLLTSLSNGLRSGCVSQINPFLLKLLLVAVFITAMGKQDRMMFLQLVTCKLVYDSRICSLCCVWLSWDQHIAESNDVCNFLWKPVADEWVALLLCSGNWVWRAQHCILVNGNFVGSHISCVQKHNCSVGMLFCPLSQNRRLQLTCVEHILSSIHSSEHFIQMLPWWPFSSFTDKEKEA